MSDSLERPSLQALVPDRHPVGIPVERLEFVFATIDEQEQAAIVRSLAKLVAYDAGEPRKPTSLRHAPTMVSTGAYESPAIDEAVVIQISKRMSLAICITGPFCVVSNHRVSGKMVAVSATWRQLRYNRIATSIGV